MRIYDVPAVSIAVRQDDAEPWAHAYGTATFGAAEAVSPRSIFQACSISKHVAALGALRLVDQGVLELDQDIDAYLVSWHLPDSGGWRAVVTLRQLLAHTAGLSYNWFRGFGQGKAVPTITEVLRGEPPATSPPVRATMLPGSGFRYSGSHYAVLQQLMEDVTGTGFAELMQSLLLEPLGMADSSYDQDFPRHHGQVAHGHHMDGAPLDGGWRVQPELAGAGLWTTPSDLCRVGVEVTHAVAGRSALLSPGLAAEMIAPQVPGGYGLGTDVQDHNGRLQFGHTGGNAGYGCWLFSWPATGTSMAVMVNNELAEEVLRAVLVAAEHHYGRAGAVGHPTPAELVGTYRVRDGYTVRITNDGDNLALHAPGQPPLGLTPLSDGRFRAAALDCELTFEDGDGDIVLRLRQQDTTLTATRQVN
ncbi:serine hydrolase domain-containing protein [Amycolatopsis taiwanensis]|uniref:serine hydrolase domain-containing protein n=1 Tax=Amycolatopsis taiwanensis TaxID=342230 RepID=UPI00146FA1DA|nr:serine hydrolase domain-containing protein [Amycolatopsis taiwanensis]